MNKSGRAVKVGDYLTVHPVSFDHGEAGERKKKTEKTARGRVVYVHPAGRYCIIEFEVGTRERATIRESFQLVKGAVLE